MLEELLLSQLLKPTMSVHKLQLAKNKVIFLVTVSCDENNCCIVNRCATHIAPNKICCEFSIQRQEVAASNCRHKLFRKARLINVHDLINHNGTFDLGEFKYVTHKQIVSCKCVLMDQYYAEVIDIFWRAARKTSFPIREGLRR
ncbi:hypothetical protein NQ318_007440 [Aromia moschata]|uniref:Uncharacterized protein n=1 Tax=Aromia moschata TaxID=1265417 RepID=A0AAV8YNF9_9CUCU|nr:hypothetical protein NQ318_007440 [Aromia moschata]